MRYPVTAILIAGLLTYFCATWLARKIAGRGFPLPKSGSRIGCVDGLRGYLALSVLVSHGVIWLQVTRLGGNWAPPTVNFLNELGAGSVALFFMVTGLVFYPRIKCGFRATSWTTVGVSRFFRIVPLQLASVILATAILAAITGNLPNADYPAAFVDWMTGSDEPPLLGYAESGRLNAYVLWSLWYEWLFYLLIMPLCAIGVDMVRGRLPAIAVPIALLLVGLSAWALGSPSKALGFLPLFAVGMIACEFQWNARVRRVLRSWQATLAGALALVLAINISAFPYNFVTLPLLALFFVCVACGNTMGGILKTDGALVLGEISFGTYVLHGLVLFGIFGGLAGFMVRLPPGILLMCALPIAGLAVVMLASATHVLIERPGIRAGVVFARILGRSAFPILSPLQSPS